MILEFDTDNRSVEVVAQAIAWRLHPLRPTLYSEKYDKNIGEEFIDKVYVINSAKAIFTTRLEALFEDLSLTDEEAVPPLKALVMEENIVVMLDTKLLQRRDELLNILPFGKKEPLENPIFVDIDTILAEYREIAPTEEIWMLGREDTIRNIIKNSLTPRFDRMETKLEKLDKNMTRGFDEATKERGEATKERNEIKEELLKAISALRNDQQR